MRSRSLAKLDRPGFAELAQLEDTGVVTKVSLDLTDPSLTYERWESIGRLLGGIDRSTRWWIGDWLNFGESVYGEEHAQASDDATTRYSEAERVTSLDHGTLLNIASICRRVVKERRREELGFWIHEEVAKLDPDKQVEWLEHAVQAGLSKTALRDAIRASEDGVPEGDGGGGPGGGEGGGVSVSERIYQAARLVVREAQANADGSFTVPPEPMAQLRSLLGDV